MVIIRHRINTIEGLKSVPTNYGVEVDIRGYGGKMLLNHDPIDDPEKYVELEEYLKHFSHAFIIFNTKEAGYEKRIIDLANKYRIKNYFLLDVEFPYLYHATRKLGVREIAVRFSEAEPLEYVKAQTDSETGEPLVEWVWVDTNTQLPLDEANIKVLGRFRTCLVCPERWGRPEDIPKYIDKLKRLGFTLDAVMTTEPYVNQWVNSGVVKE